MKRKRAKDTHKKLSDQQRAAWLLGFVQQDVDNLRPGELLNLGEDVERYLLDPRMTIAPGDGDENAMVILKARDREPDPDPHLSWLHARRRHLLQRLQINLRAGMRALHDGKEWSPFAEAPKDRTISPDDNVAPSWTYVRGEEDGEYQRRYEGPLLTVLLISAGDLLMQWWRKVRRCKNADCKAAPDGAFFLPHDGRQRYHDERCAGLARWHRKAQRDRDHKKEETRRLYRRGEITLTEDEKKVVLAHSTKRGK